MQSKTEQTVLVADSIFAGICIFLTGVSILLRTAHGADILRFWSVIPFGIYGGTAIQDAFKHGYGDQSDIPGAKAMRLSEAIHGIVVSTLPNACWNLL